MASADSHDSASRIQHVFDGSLSSHPRLASLARAASEILDREIDADFPATATWSINPESKELHSGSISEFSEEGPIRVKLRDEELGIVIRRHLRVRDIGGDSHYWIRRLWGSLLSARVDKLHELVFHADEAGDPNR